ncbi:hypothetical protein EV360DRAFT_84899 [Lentinula raphanica]|nr:hypothetical protein EV360DRAFT_84899 [Lentinula raphanica]
MEPLDESMDEETSSTSPAVWWRRQTYDYTTYRLDSDGMIQKIYHDPEGEELSTKTRGRAKTPPPKGGLKKSENSTSAKDGDRGSTPVSFKPLGRAAKYFLQGGAHTSNINNEPFGPTKLETTSFKSSDSEGHNAWHSSQLPHDLDAPLSETPTPRMIGTTYVHRNTTDGGYQVEGWFVLMDVENPAVLHRAALDSSSPMGWRDSKKIIESEDETLDHGNNSDSDTESQISMVQDCTSSSNTLANHSDNLKATESMDAVITRKPITGKNATRRLPEQKADDSNPVSDTQKSNTSHSPGDHSSARGNYMGEETLNEFPSTTGITNIQPVENAVFSSSPAREPGVEKELVTESGFSGLPTNPTVHLNTQESRTEVQPLFVLEELLDRFGDLVMRYFPLSQALFKVGGLMYLLFLVRVFQKIYTMFQSQKLAVGLGNLGFSIALSFLIRFCAPEQIKVPVDPVGGVAY